MSFEMSLVASYSEEYAGEEPLSPVGYINLAIAQSFKGNGANLSSCKFYLKKVGSPTGDLLARLDSHTGTYGSTGVPLATLATSVAVDSSTVGTDYSLVEFTFEDQWGGSPNQLGLTDDTAYLIELYMAGDDENNHILAGIDTATLGASGNYARYQHGGVEWEGTASGDLVFYVYGESPIVGVKYPLPAFKKS